MTGVSPARPARPASRAGELCVYADGSGEAKAGRPGGWAFLVVEGDEVLAQGSGRVARTSCLFMELEAARSGLEAVLARAWHLDRAVVLVSDSSIALEVAAGRFLPRPARYHAAAAALREVALACGAQLRWVPAHAGEPWNEQVDALARVARLAA